MNYKYLRVDTANGSKMDIFCAACHPMKADPKSAANAKATLFNSMDENLYKGSGSESAPAAPAPAGRKKQQQ